jgi:integrase
MTAGELRRLRSGAADDELVFTTGGKRIDPSNLMSRVLKPAAVEAGLGVWRIENGERRSESWIGFHTLRHTCATLLFASGWNAKQVQRWLGHHKASFTLDTYVHLLPDDLPEPPAIGCDSNATQTGRNGPSRELQAVEG